MKKTLRRLHKGPGLFVTGTDTGVGKTWVACRLAEALRREGLRVGVFKPAESGDGGDAAALAQAAGCMLPLSLIRPYRFKRPLAPAVAADLEGKKVSLSLIKQAYGVVSEVSDWTLVEGAGGLLVPYAKGLDGAGVAKALGLPLLIIARAGLGTINHTLLTLEAARKRRLKVLGVLLNGKVKAGDSSVRTNAQVIAKLGKVPVYGPLPWGRRDLALLKIPMQAAGR